MRAWDTAADKTAVPGTEVRYTGEAWKETKYLRGMLRFPWRWAVNVTSMRESRL